MKLRVGVFSACLSLASLASGQTALTMDPQPTAPARIAKPLHGIPEALLSASVENRGEKTIVACRIGWIAVEDGVPHFHAGCWNQLRDGLASGMTREVPAQGIALDTAARKMIFLISELRFADGTSWRSPEMEAAIEPQP